MSRQNIFLMGVMFLVGCASQKPPSIPEQVVLIPPLAGRERNRGGVAAQKPQSLPSLPEDGRLEESLMAETDRLQLPQGTRCVLWNPLVDQGRSTKAFLLRIQPDGVRMDELKLQEEADIQKTQTAFQKRGERLSGLAGTYGWMRVCKLQPQAPRGLSLLKTP